MFTRRYFVFCAKCAASLDQVIMSENEIIARNVKDIRKSFGLSQIDFAANCGISVEELSLIERNRADPKLSTLQKIAAYIGEPVAYLITENDGVLYTV